MIFLIENKLEKKVKKDESKKKYHKLRSSSFKATNQMITLCKGRGF